MWRKTNKMGLFSPTLACVVELNIYIGVNKNLLVVARIDGGRGVVEVSEHSNRENDTTSEVSGRERRKTDRTKGEKQAVVKTYQVVAEMR